MAMFDSEFMRHVGDEYAARDRAHSQLQGQVQGQEAGAYERVLLHEVRGKASPLLDTASGLAHIALQKGVVPTSAFQIEVPAPQSKRIRGRAEAGSRLHGWLLAIDGVQTQYDAPSENGHYGISGGVWYPVAHYDLMTDGVLAYSGSGLTTPLICTSPEEFARSVLLMDHNMLGDPGPHRVLDAVQRGLARFAVDHQLVDRPHQ